MAKSKAWRAKVEPMQTARMPSYAPVSHTHGGAGDEAESDAEGEEEDEEEGEEEGKEDREGRATATNA